MSARVVERRYIDSTRLVIEEPQIQLEFVRTGGARARTFHGLCSPPEIKRHFNN